MPAAASLFLQRFVLPPAGFVDAACDAIVAAERARVPDLTRAVVLVPDLHAAGDVARALRRAAAVPALLLPRITTLELWAATVPPGKPVATRAAREALLYQELEQRGWLASADLWAVSAELAGLFDELTRSSVALPGNFRAFNRQLERAYRARSGTSLTFEAKLVHELWHVLERVTSEVSPASAHQLGLASIAATASAPLYALGLSRLSPGEEAFLENYAERAPVSVFSATREDAIDSLSCTLAGAWPRAAERPGLRDRAQQLKAAHPQSALAGRVRIIGAASAEQEAQAVDVTVREWLLAGKRRIAIVVLDRLVARRARAFLERAQVLVKDEAGWAFSTTSAATAIGRWLDIAGGDCYYRDLLDLMKSPFAFHDWQRGVRRAAVWRFEAYVRRENVVSGLGNFVELAEAKRDPEVRQMLARVRQAVSALGRGRRTIPRWLAALSASLDEIGLLAGLAADSAGSQLVELMGRLADELAGATLAVDFSEWRRWLARQLEEATFRDRAIDSPVVFTSLAATRLRAFDAVLILGSDAAHLPGPDPVALFFSQSVRAELKLPTWSERVSDMVEEVAALVASSAEVAITWQRMIDGEHNLLSPLFGLLSALHQLAYQHGLEDGALAARLRGAEVRPVGARLELGGTRTPAPEAGSLLPRRISASAYNALVACPYQYYAGYVLGLKELDEVEEELQKRDYGSLLHDVLATFHRAHAATSGQEPAAAQAELERLSEQAFAPVVARNYFAQAWLARWKGLIPSYLAWQRARETAGWTWSGAEVDRSIEITTPKGATVTLHGRLDRIDVARDGPPLDAGSGRPSDTPTQSRRPSRASPGVAFPETGAPAPPIDAASGRPSDTPTPSHRPPRASPGVASPETGAPAPPLDAPPPWSPAYSVIDYKARAVKPLEDALRIPGEDVQLAVYALLWGNAVTEAMFLSVDRREVEAVAPDQEIRLLARGVGERLAAMFDALAAGAKLRAQGTEAACEYCDARGLCRKDYWND